MGVKKVLFCLLWCFGISLATEKLLIDQLRWEFLEFEDDLWDMVLNQTRNIRDPEYTIVRKFYDFDQRIQEMPEDILRGLEPIRGIHPFLFLYSDMKIIHNLYDKFREFQHSVVFAKRDDQQQNPDDLIRDILYRKNSVNKTITNIYNLTFGKENMLWEVYKIFDKEDTCKTLHQSKEQVFYNLYNTIALTGLKGYMMQQFAYLTLRIYEKGNYTNEGLNTRSQFITRVNDTMILFTGAMLIGSGTVWRCDPSVHKKGETYEEITKLLQGHIQNEVDMNNYGTCTKNCGAYTITQSYGCYDSGSEYCQKVKKCNGLLIGCHFVESSMSVCIAPPDSPRRYEFVRYSSGRTMGHSSRCMNRLVDSWNRWFVHCSYCMCLCDESGPQSDRFFSLRPVLANTDDNMVVTGLRLVKANRIIHLQIQEGKLLPYGYIDNATVRWVPINAFNIYDTGVKEGKDYLTFSYQQRTMVLDKLSGHELDDLLTGVKFGKALNGILQLEAKFSTFNFTNGNILGNDYYVHGTGTGSRIDLKNADVPIKSLPSEPNLSDTQMVEFTHTSYDLDAAQTTVPFFDLQPVYSNPAVPLSGAGLYYKGRPNYGGFVAPSISTYKFVRHMSINLPNMTKRADDMEELGIEAN